MSGREGIHAVLISDSRGYNFDNTNLYRPPPPPPSGQGYRPYKTHYIIKRGATPDSIIRPAECFFKSNIIPSRDIILVKLALGINSIINRDTSTNPPKYDHVGTEQAFLGLVNLKNAILKIRPDCQVSFATIPPAKLDNNQQQHLWDIKDLNTKLSEENQTARKTEPPSALHTLCWHSEILKTSKNAEGMGPIE